MANIAGHLGAAIKEIQRRQVQHFTKANAEYGARVEQSLGLDVARPSPGLRDPALRRSSLNRPHRD